EANIFHARLLHLRVEEDVTITAVSQCHEAPRWILVNEVLNSCGAGERSRTPYLYESKCILIPSIYNAYIQIP
ncbi:MAG: hypothetical protein P8N43_10145, partial [Alphaproteobacteria bacterium]|nr:hypothetical protein [Alphaproteobacteria bacterium]